MVEQAASSPIIYARRFFDYLYNLIEFHENELAKQIKNNIHVNVFESLKKRIYIDSNGKFYLPRRNDSRFSNLVLETITGIPERTLGDWRRLPPISEKYSVISNPIHRIIELYSYFKKYFSGLEITLRIRKVQNSLKKYLSTESILFVKQFSILFQTYSAEIKQNYQWAKSLSFELDSLNFLPTKTLMKLTGLDTGTINAWKRGDYDSIGYSVIDRVYTHIENLFHNTQILLDRIINSFESISQVSSIIARKIIKEQVSSYFLMGERNFSSSEIAEMLHCHHCEKIEIIESNLFALVSNMSGQEFIDFIFLDKEFEDDDIWIPYITIPFQNIMNLIDDCRKKGQLNKLVKALYFMIFGTSSTSFQNIERLADIGGLDLESSFNIADWVIKVMNRGDISPSRLQVPVVCRKEKHHTTKSVKNLPNGCSICNRWTNEQVTRLILLEIFGLTWGKVKVTSKFSNSPPISIMDPSKMSFDHGEEFTIGYLLKCLEDNNYITTVPYKGTDKITKSERDILISPIGESDGIQHCRSAEGFINFLGLRSKDQEINILISKLGEKVIEEIINKFQESLFLTRH